MSKCVNGIFFPNYVFLVCGLKNTSVVLLLPLRPIPSTTGIGAKTKNKTIKISNMLQLFL